MSAFHYENCSTVFIVSFPDLSHLPSICINNNDRFNFSLIFRFHALLERSKRERPGTTVFIHTTSTYIIGPGTGSISSGHMIMFSDHAPLQVAKQARTVVTMLPTGANVVECYEGENGIFRCAM